MTDDQVVSAFIGRPYAFGARGPAAYDCWGLVLAVRAALGLPVPPDFAAPDAVSADARARLAVCAREAPYGQTGAILYTERTCHAGHVWRGSVVHAMKRYGVVAWPLGRWMALFPDSRGYQWP